MTLTRITAAKDLDVNRQVEFDRIDVMAKQVRARFATPDTHQIYADKRREAEAYTTALAMNAGDPSGIDLTEFPYLSGEIGLTAPDAATLATLWLTLSAQWQLAASWIETLRIGGKADVRAAGSPALITAAADSAIAALDEIGVRPPAPPPPTPRFRT